MSLVFQKKCIEDFRKKFQEWDIFKEEPISIVKLKDLEDIVEKLEDLAEIGNEVIVDFGEIASFDNFKRIYSIKNLLYIAWYENEDRFMNGIYATYLRLSPKEMFIYGDKFAPEKNVIIIRSNKITTRLPNSAYIDSEERFIDLQGKISPTKRPSVITTLCEENMYALFHPKGSIYTDDTEKDVFLKRLKATVKN